MIFIPKEIKVGYQNRRDTYTGKLAYIIYTDDKGKLRKENSWQSWRDDSINPDDITNEPTEGFVLNKKVGGYKSDWNFRNAYTRVYDPRGFEFEITIENLLFILENTNSIVGKGLEGEFVYGWQGTELILIPTCSPDYKKLIIDSQKRFDNDFVKTKELREGVVYTKSDDTKLMFLGRGVNHLKYFGSAYKPGRMRTTSSGMQTEDDFDRPYITHNKKGFWFFDMSRIDMINGDNVYYRHYGFVWYAALPKLYNNTDGPHTEYANIMARREDLPSYNPQYSLKLRTTTHQDLLDGLALNKFIHTFDDWGIRGISQEGNGKSYSFITNYGGGTESLPPDEFIKKYHIKTILETVKNYE